MVYKLTAATAASSFLKIKLSWVAGTRTSHFVNDLSATAGFFPPTWADPSCSKCFDVFFAYAARGQRRKLVMKYPHAGFLPTGLNIAIYV